MSSFETAEASLLSQRKDSDATAAQLLPSLQDMESFHSRGAKVEEPKELVFAGEKEIAQAKPKADTSDVVDAKQKEKIVAGIKDGKINDEFKDAYLKAFKQGGAAEAILLSMELNKKLADANSPYRISMAGTIDKKTGDQVFKIWISDKKNDDPKGQPAIEIRSRKVRANGPTAIA